MEESLQDQVKAETEGDGGIPLPRNAASACLGEMCCCAQTGASRESVLDISCPLLNQNYVPLEKLNLPLKL